MSSLDSMANPSEPYVGTPPRKRNPLRPARIGWEVAVWLALWALLAVTLARLMDPLLLLVPYAVARAVIVAFQYHAWRR